MSTAARDRTSNRRNSGKVEDATHNDDPADTVKPRGDEIGKEQHFKTLSEKELFCLEELESVNHDAASDLQTFKHLASTIRDSFKVIKDLKESGTKTAVSEVQDQKILTCLLIAKLRKLNRLGHMRCAKVKDATNQQRNKIDEYHLRLQNLHYEMGHLQKEIRKCLEFRSKDEELRLVDVRDFYSQAPEEISRSAVTKADDHELHKGRLQWEVEQRKQLASQLDAARKEIDLVQADIQLRESKLESLLPKLGTILEATKPVQEFLQMPYDETKEQHDLARFLPLPLYVLFRSLTALELSSQNSGVLKARLFGDIEAAKCFSEKTMEEDDDSDSDQDDDGQHKSSHRRRRMSSREEAMQVSTLRTHPLSIHVELVCQKGRASAKLHVYFYYMVQLGIVTVKGLVDENLTSSCVSGGDLLQADLILGSLYPNDQGLESPNPANQAELNKLQPSDIQHYLPTIGAPYRWAQSVSGLLFLPLQDKVSTSSLDASGVADVLKRIKKRTCTRIALISMLSELERNQLPIVAPQWKQLFPVRPPSTVLTSWTRSTLEELFMLPYATDFTQLRLLGQGSHVFIAVFSCLSYRLTAHVVVGADYPITPPLMLTQLCNGDSCLNRLNSDVILSLEREVNCLSECLTRSSQILSIQLLKIAWCLDVYAAVVSEGSRNEGVIPVKLLPTPYRGRSRELPFRYNAITGFFVHC